MGRADTHEQQDHNASEVIVYSKKPCPQCDATFRKLKQEEMEHTVVDITDDEAALAYIKELGYLQAPVVVTPFDHWSGYRPDKIMETREHLLNAA